MFVDGELNSQKLLKTFEYDLMNETIADENWSAVIEKAIDTCSDLGRLNHSLKLIHLFKTI